MTTLRWLSGGDVARVAIGPEECLDLIRRTLIWRAEGRIEVPPKLGIHPPAGRHIHAMPGLIAPLAAAGVKWIADHPKNVERGLPTISALIVLNDIETGIPICVMDGARVTALRTAALSGISLAACGAPSPRVAAIVGTGVQARAHLEALPSALPTLETVRVAGLTPALARDFCALFDGWAGPGAVPVGSIEEAVRPADVVITVTNAVSAKLLELEWLKRGVTVAVLDNAGKETAIVHEMDRVVVDDRAQFETPEVRARFSGGVPPIDAEISDVVAGRAVGRQDATERVLVMNLGSAMGDIAVAAEVHRRAAEARIGTVVER